jgi:FkbM family methyltransferase
MIGRILGLIAKKRIQWFWQWTYKISIGGLGYMNSEPKYNGELWFLQKWAIKKLKSTHNKLVIFDVGANEGEFSAAFLKYINNCEIHCFEPNKTTFDRLSARFSKDSRIKINNLGLGSRNENMSLYDYANSNGSGHASFLQSTFEDIYPAETQRCEARIVRLDDYAKQQGISYIDFLKIDVEGYERAVLEGASDMISNSGVETIQMEFNAHNLISELSILKLSKILKNYNIYRLISNALVPLMGKDIKYNSRVEIFKYCNLIATKDD